MERDTTDRRLIGILSSGLPLVSRPYGAVAEGLGIAEAEVMDRIERLEQEDALSRFGVIVRHHEIGYRANAMVVWDIPDGEVRAVGQRLAKEDCVTLCYQRPRREGWPYNLFTMIHGQSRDETLGRLEEMTERCGLMAVERDILFSTRAFKQRGANYGVSADAEQDIRHEAATP